MRARVLRPLLVAAVLGAVAGSLVAFAGQAWAVRDLPREFSYVSYSPTPDDLTFGLADGWWQLLWPAVVTGLVVAVLGAIVLTLRRHGRTSPPRGWRGLLALAAVGVVLGGAVGGALYLRAESKDEGQPRRNVDYLPTSDDGAYDSTLTITLDEEPSNVAAFFAVCAGVGLGCGLVTGGALVVARRRRA